MGTYYNNIFDIIPDSELICDYELEVMLHNVDWLESINIE